MKRGLVLRGGGVRWAEDEGVLRGARRDAARRPAGYSDWEEEEERGRREGELQDEEAKGQRVHLERASDSSST